MVWCLLTKVKIELPHEGRLGVSGKRLSLDFSSGHDLEFCEFEPHIVLCADSTELAGDSVCLSLSLRINKRKKKRELSYDSAMLYF